MPEHVSSRLLGLWRDLEPRRAILFLINIGLPILVGVLRGETSAALIGGITGLLLSLADNEGPLVSRLRLTLMVAAHTTGRDGVAAESSPPDRVIDVKIRTNPFRRALQLTGVIVAALAGAAIARFGQVYWPLVSAVIKQTLGI